MTVSTTQLVPSRPARHPGGPPRGGSRGSRTRVSRAGVILLANQLDAMIDTGVPLGLAEATVSVGLRRPDLSAEFRLHVAEELAASLVRD